MLCMGLTCHDTFQLITQGSLMSPQSTFVTAPLGTGHKAATRRSVDLESQGSLDSDFQPGSLASALIPGVDGQGLTASRLSQRGSTQSNSDLHSSSSQQQPANCATMSVSQAGAFPVRQGSRAASWQELNVKSTLTMERFPVSPRLLGRRSVSLSKQPLRALTGSTAVADAAALQLTGAPLQRLGSHAGNGSKSLPRSSSSVDSSSAGHSKSRHNCASLDLQQASGSAAECMRAEGGSNTMTGKGLLHRVQGSTDGARTISGRSAVQLKPVSCGSACPLRISICVERYTACQLSQAILAVGACCCGE